MGAISGSKAYYGLSSTGTPSGTNLSGTVVVGKAQTVINLTSADIAYSFTIASTGATDVATLTISSGAVAQTTGTPTITDGDGNDFEGVALATLSVPHMILVEPVGTTTGTMRIVSSSSTNGIDKYIGIGSTYPFIGSFPATGTIAFTFTASADSYKVTVIGGSVMALDLKPIRFDLPSVTVGDTYPAILFGYDGTGTLSRVRMKIKDSDGVNALSLDSDSTGMAITSSTTGAWAFTMQEISAATTEGLTAGCHNYDLETTTSAGTVSTLLSGGWELLKQITD